MSLEPFDAKTVTPGEPITADAWNTLVNGISVLNEFIRNSQSASLRVTLVNTNIRLETLRVTARRDSDGWLAEAIAPVNGDGQFVFAALPQGAFTVRAEAPGFKPATANITIPTEPAAPPLSLTMQQDGAFMPNLIGKKLEGALKELSDGGITVGRLLDVVGRDLAPANPAAEYLDQPVLMQLPAPDVAVPPAGKVQLVVAAALQVEESVEIPPLTGLTLTEARKALEAIGLKLGKVETRQAKATSY